MAGLMSNVGCPAGSDPQPASIPTRTQKAARSTPTTPHVPMFPQDARDAMMSAPEEMETRISWTTECSIQEVKDHLRVLGDRRRCVTISASQMEAALSHTSDHQDLVGSREAAFLMNLEGAVLEHQMNVINATKRSPVLRKKKRNQILIPDIQEVILI